MATAVGLFANNAGGHRPENIGELLLRVGFLFREVTESETRDRLEEMEANLSKRKDANAALAALRQNMPQTNEADAKEYGSFMDHNGVSQSVHTWMLHNGFHIESIGGDTKGKRNEFEAAIESLKEGLETWNTMDQIAMVKLQNANNQANQATEFTTNMVTKEKGPKDTIIGNLSR